MKIGNIENQFLGYLFIFFVFFPYITIIHIGTDIQPYALLLAMLIFVKYRLTFSPIMVLLMLLGVYSVILFFMSPMGMSEIRSMVNYLSIFLISYVSYKLLRKKRVNLEWVISNVTITWFIVGLVQTLVDREFLNFLLPRALTTDHRGVVGLTPEPTFYGIYFIFILLIITHIKHKYKKTLIFLCVMQIIVFSMSATAVLLLLIMFVLMIITSGKFFSIKRLFWLILAILIFILYLSLVPQSRMSLLLDRLFDNPYKLVLRDESVNDRFFHMFFSVKGFFENIFLPHGYGAWKEYLIRNIAIYREYILLKFFSIGDRIMSGYGSALFEVGIFALIIPFSIISLLFNIYKSQPGKFIFYSVFINLIMFSAIQLAFPVFAFYIGFLNYLHTEENREIIA